MKIQKRDGCLEQLSFDKIIYRLKKLCNDKSLGALKTIDPDVVAQRVVSSIYDGVTSTELDEEAARIAVNMTENLEYGQLASRIIISNLHKSTIECFSEVMEALYNNTDKTGAPMPVIADDIMEIIRTNKDTLNFAIDYSRDYLFDYFGYKTLEKGYLLKLLDKQTGKMIVVERPQHLYMRVAVGIHKGDIEAVVKTYHYISQHYYTHASPTLFNSSTRLANLSSCFLLGSQDSIEGIYKTITDCGRISKVGGGIGVHISNIRAKGSIIRGTNGTSDGIIPMIKVYNSTCCYINQSGRRKGSFALYTEPWHADILEFLDLKKNQGHDDIRARDLFYALWTPDLFMKQVEADGDWYLMCPDECPGLTDAYGDAFEALYWKYVEEKRYKRVVKAQEVWKKVLDAQIETGVPYIGYKDAVNKKCNQKNLGTIKSSNLCIEISLYSDHQEYAVCNLCSIALPKFVEYDAKGKPFYNFEKLREVAEYVVEPMNKVIDHNHYPTEETRISNMKHRPLGIGIQGLADVYFKMKLPFESPEAAQLNREIFETLYYGVMRGSVELAKREGHYASFAGSPFSEGKLQFDLAAEFDGIDLTQFISGRWDWEALKTDLKQYGARNSMLTALMPTASSAQIMGNSECFEPIDSCIFKRRVLSGEYMVVNKYLVAELVKLGLWNKTMKDTIIAHDGSIQSIPEIPDDIKQIYKTVWEISMKNVIEQSRDRQAFVDQMQSMNLFMANPNYKKLTSMHFYSWKANLKSGMYYLRSRASASAGKFSIDANLEKKIRAKQELGKKLTKNEEKMLCSIDNREACEMCTS
ncbi:MAG: ribonucleoside-diphosphate reductase subunit alpha [Proteobacteria bacterium]|nr:ribonucleoside-diphosphate reductase subunit alpha [Pseudomonadota bacterium]NBP15318.1 ribonucleoside-diphosphate reductase subunit alpha [bacterium]